MGVLKSHNSSVKVTDIVIRVSFSTYARTYAYKLLVAKEERGMGNEGRSRALQRFAVTYPTHRRPISTSHRARSNAQFCTDQHRYERK